MQVTKYTPSLIGRVTAALVFLAVTASLGYYLIIRDQLSRLGRDAIRGAAQGNFDIAGQYLKLAGSVNLTDKVGFSLSYYAVAYEEHELLQELISQGADVRRVPAGAEDLMLVAIAQEDLTSVCLLAGSGQWSDTEYKLLDEYLRRASMHNSEVFLNGMKECFNKTHDGWGGPPVLDH